MAAGFSGNRPPSLGYPGDGNMLPGSDPGEQPDQYVAGEPGYPAARPFRLVDDGTIGRLYGDRGDDTTGVSGRPLVGDTARTYGPIGASLTEPGRTQREQTWVGSAARAARTTQETLGAGRHRYGEWRQRQAEDHNARADVRMAAGEARAQMRAGADARRSAINEATAAEPPAMSFERAKEKGVRGTARALRVKHRGKIDDEIVSRHERAISAFLATRSEAQGRKEGDEVTLDDMTDAGRYALTVQRQQLLGYRNKDEPLNISPRAMGILRGIERAYLDTAYRDARQEEGFGGSRRRANRRVLKSYRAKLAQTTGSKSDAELLFDNRGEYFVARQQPAVAQRRSRSGTSPTRAGQSAGRTSSGDARLSSAREGTSVRSARLRRPPTTADSWLAEPPAGHGRDDLPFVRLRSRTAGTDRPLRTGPAERQPEAGVNERWQEVARAALAIREQLNQSDGGVATETMLTDNVRGALYILGRYPEDEQTRVLDALGLAGVLVYDPYSTSPSRLGRYTPADPGLNQREVVGQVARALSERFQPATDT